MAAEGLEQGNDVLNSRFYNFEQIHWHGIPIGDYSTFNLLKTSCVFILFGSKRYEEEGGVGQRIRIKPIVKAVVGSIFLKSLSLSYRKGTEMR